MPTTLGLDVEHRDDPEAVVGEDVGAGDRLAEVAGAEQGDVVLAGGAQDLADLGDERLDVVADAALAELAEAGEVAADLGRVDVRVLGELLRGDRLPAHLAGLGQHLQVAREPRRDAQRKPLAVGDQRRRPPPAPRPSRSIIGTHSIEPGPKRDASRRARRRPRRRPRRPGSAPDPPQQQVVGLDVDLAQLESVALAVQRDDRLARLVAEVAARPRVDGTHAQPRDEPPTAPCSVCGKAS